jgi:hypothetical protein
MMVDVHMADGRTVFRFKSRSQFIDLLSRNLDALDEAKAVACWVRWHPQDEFMFCRIMSVRKHSVAFTRAVTGEERDAFDVQFPPPEKKEVV